MTANTLMQRLQVRSPYWSYLLLWFGLNLVQALTTELLHDEAYYWIYSGHLDWGYFDHPPAVAVLIWLGRWIPGELGVRLTTILIGTGVLWFFFHWIRPRKPLLLFLLVTSMVLFHLGGFVAVPDIALLAMTCVFLFTLERYFEKDSNKLALALGLMSALLIYSKYHGVILLIFAIVPNLGLLVKRRSFWLIPLTGILLFTPHLLWQWQNDFVTFRFHLFERGGRGFRWDFPLSYLYGQLALYGAFVSFVVIWSIRYWDVRTRMRRTLLWIVSGVFGLFLLMSFRGRVEANWTAIALPALVFLSYKAIEEQQQLQRWLRFLAVPSILLILAVRLLFAVDITTMSKFRETHGWREWADVILAATEGSTPVFRNSYQQAAKFTFYTGQPSYSLNSPNYKGNQYDYLPELEERLQGTRVTVLASSYSDSLEARLGEPLPTNIDSFHTLRFDDFVSYNRLEFRVAEVPVVSAGAVVRLSIEVSNPGAREIVIRGGEASRLKLWARAVETRVEHWIDLGKPTFERIGPGETLTQDVRFVTPDATGTYEFRIGLLWNYTGGKNSFLYRLEVI